MTDIIQYGLIIVLFALVLFHHWQISRLADIQTRFLDAMAELTRLVGDHLDATKRIVTGMSKVGITKVKDD